MRKMGLLTAFFLSAAPALWTEGAVVRRGDLVIHVQVRGTIVPEDVFDVKSPIEGRVENVRASTGSWHAASEPLANLAITELAAMLDSGGDLELLKDRWRNVYQLTPVSCPKDCYILQVKTSSKTKVREDDVLFEAARRFKLVAHVRHEDIPFVYNGQAVAFWTSSDPKRRFVGAVQDLTLDAAGNDSRPGATFSMSLKPGMALDLDAPWEGDIAIEKKALLVVPTAAIIHSGNAAYLPVRVSTGISTAGLTQITAGVEEGRNILILNGAREDLQESSATIPSPAAARQPEAPPAAAAPVAPKKTSAAKAPQAPQAPAQASAPAQQAAPAPRPSSPVKPVLELSTPASDVPDARQAAPIDDKSYGGEDPYGEQ